MITLHDILCILGWHDWRYKTYGGLKFRRCLRCPKHQELVGIGVYSNWRDKA